MAFALRQLGATVGRNLQCAHNAVLSGPLDLLSIEDNVAISTGAYIHTTRWSGQRLHVGPVRLESGCKIGMRAAVSNNVTVGRGAWITPFTPILRDVGSQEMWEGSPARLTGRCTELKRTASVCRYARPIWLLETLNILMQISVFFVLSVVPTAAILWFAGRFMPAGEADLSDAYFRVTPLLEIVWRLTLYAFVTTWVVVVVTSVLACLFIRCTAASPGLYPSRGLKGALLMYRMSKMNASSNSGPGASPASTCGRSPACAFRGWAPRSATSCSTLSRSSPPPIPRCSGPTDVSRTCSTTAPSTSSCAVSTCRPISSAAATAWRNTGISPPTSSWARPRRATTYGSGGRCGRDSASRSRWRGTRP